MKQLFYRLAFILPLAMIIIPPQGVEGKGMTNHFPVGRILSIEELSKIPTKDAELVKATIGGVSEKAVKKYGNFEAYILKRGGMESKSIGGKAFEALTVKQFKRFAKKIGIEEQLVTTASLGKTADAADLIRIDAHGRVLESYQLKSGHNAAKRALRNPKYDGKIIVTHPDELKKIIKEIEKRELSGKKLSPTLAEAKKAIESGRLTDKIAGMKVHTRDYSISRGVRSVQMQFHSVLKRISNTSAGKVIAQVAGKIPGSTLVKPLGETAARGVIKTIRYLKIFTKVLGPLDIAFSSHQMYHTASQYHLYDNDIFAGRVAAQGGLMAIGIGLLVAPEPVITKIGGGVIFIATLTLAGTDVALEQVHFKRLASRAELMKKMDARDKHKATADLLRKMIEHPKEEHY